MKPRDIIALVGAFLAGFGALVIANDVPPWAHWVGQAMVVAGPLLMGSRALMAGKPENDRKDPQP